MKKENLMFCISMSLCCANFGYSIHTLEGYGTRALCMYLAALVFFMAFLIGIINRVCIDEVKDGKNQKN